MNALHAYTHSDQYAHTVRDSATAYAQDTRSNAAGAALTI